MMQKAESLLLSIFGWVMGPMVTAILAITVLNYKATLDGNKLLQEHKLDQYIEIRAISRQLYNDSIKINELQAELSLVRGCLIKIDPVVFDDVFYGNEENILPQNSKAILPKKKYLTDTKIRLR
jgi:hypothetical protein